MIFLVLGKIKRLNTWLSIKIQKLINKVNQLITMKNWAQMHATHDDVHQAKENMENPIVRVQTIWIRNSPNIQIQAEHNK